jgi:outer membrane protein
MNTKSIFKTWVLILLSFSTLNAFSQNTRIGYLDYSSVIYDLPEFKSYSDSLEKYSEYLDTELEKIKEDYFDQLAKVEKLKKQKDANLSLIELAEETLFKYQQLYQVEAQRNQGKMQKKEQDLQIPLRKKLDDAIEAISKEKGFTMVVDVNVLYYKKDTDDIEDLVRTKLKLISKAESEKKRKQLAEDN